MDHAPGVSISDSIAVRLALVSRTDNGTLLFTKLIDAAVRGALLCDLAFAGRLIDQPDGIEVELTSTGFRPADEVLAGMGRQPGRTLDEWLATGPALREVADELLRSGRWVAERSRVTRVRRYRDQQLSARKGEIEAARHALLGGRPLSPAVATYLLLADQAELIDQYSIVRARVDAPAVEPEDCGSAAWLLPAIIDHVAQLRAQMNLMRSSSGTAGSGV